MPYIEATFSKTLTEQQKNELKTQFGKAIELIKGKSEDWLMVAIKDGVSMFFKGDGTSDFCYVSISVFGSASKADCNEMTGAVCALVENITSTTSENTYVTYSSFDKWGWNGSNL